MTLIYYKPGDILLDKYRIEELIGEGAFAEVYLATHIELNVPRALNILRKEAPGVGSTEFEDFQERFKLEVQLGARINHPNVVQVHDFEREGDTLILVMEYCPGGSLAERIRLGNENNDLVPIDEAVKIGIETASGLGAIHALDAVHRDLKPNNILFDKNQRAKVADLGLAQIPGGPSMRSKFSLTAPHPGTPAYMSPEQASQSGYLKPASDVYILGLVLFETLTGRNYNNLKPGTHVKRYRTDVPGWLDRSLLQMLSESVNTRPWDGNEGAKLLRRGPVGFKLKSIWGKLGVSLLLFLILLMSLWGMRKYFGSSPNPNATLTYSFIGNKQPETITPSITTTETLEPILTPTTAIINTGQPSQIPTSTYVKNTVSMVATVLSPLKYSEEIIDDFGIPMVLVPAGSFQMGSEEGEEDERPVHKVFLDDYYIDKYEVTNANYAQCVDAGACEPPRIVESNEQKFYYGNSKFADYPVIWVTWEKAHTYCNWRNGRLPTEAEWEKAARGGLEGKLFPWGDELPICKTGAINGARFYNGIECTGGADPLPVGSYSPNGYGIYDMAGNVWEWMADFYGDYSKSPEIDPTGPSNGGIRVIRGGGVCNCANLFSLYVSDREVSDPNISWNIRSIGIRCVGSP